MSSLLKTLPFLVGAISAIAVDTSLEGTACFIANTAEFAYFNLGDMTKKDGDYVSTDGLVRFNFCTYAALPADDTSEMDTYAY